MEVHFTNSHGSRIWIAVMYYEPGDCGEYGNWGTEGWWNITQGQDVHPLNTNNRYFCYYAEAEDGTVWAGDRGPVYVYHSAFDSCLDIGSTAAYGTVGMRLKDGGSAGKFTVHLV